ncbi:TraA family conjugative transfer protein [Noviherbaspirillum pedocola]|nr:TraA family conjugative transfer protein [Noviherbaspirillum pedocola]
MKLKQIARSATLSATSFAKEHHAFLLAFVVVAAMVSGSAIAGSDSTFATVSTNLDGWMTGSLGKVFSLAALAVGLGIGVIKQSILSVATGVGVALASSIGPGVLTNMFSAAM